MLLFLYFFIAACSSVKKVNQHIETEIPVDKLKKDIRFVQKKIVKWHPSIDWYISKEKLLYSFDSLVQVTNKPMKPNEFYHAISPVVAKVKQAHMTVGMLVKRKSKT